MSGRSCWWFDVVGTAIYLVPVGAKRGNVKRISSFRDNEAGKALFSIVSSELAYATAFQCKVAIS